MLVKEVMNPQCVYCGDEVAIASAAKIMAKHDYGVLPVARHEKLVGIVTDRDLVVRGLAIQDEFPDIKVGDIMTDEVFYCYEHQPCAEIAQNMAELQVRRMPVVDREKNLVGLVSLGDLARGGEKLAAAHVLEGTAEVE